MSQATAVRAPARTPARGIPRTAQPPRLRVVDLPAHTRSRAGLVVVCVTLLVLGLVTLLVVNVSLERGAYELRSQRTRSAQLAEQRQALQEQIAALQAPEALAAKAASLGMVAAPNVAFLRKSDGSVLGVPSRAVSNRPPTVETTAAASPSAQPSGTTGAGTTLGVSATVAPVVKPSTAATASAKAGAKPTASANTKTTAPSTRTTTKTAATKPAATKGTTKPATATTR